MKIIINVSNLYIGGGVQVAISFLNELRFMSAAHEYHIFLSKPIDKQIEKSLFPDNFIFYFIEKSAAQLKTRYIILKQLNELENTISPDIVFTPFGPSFWKSKAKNLMGFADPWVLNPNSVVFEELSFFQRIKKRLLNAYKVYYLKRESDYFVIETNIGKSKLIDLLHILDEQVFVVSNCYNGIFNQKALIDENNEAYIKLPKREEEEFRLVLISHNYPHKNLKIIRRVVPLIKFYNIKFILTIDKLVFEALFDGLEDHIYNIGPVELKSCPSIYSQCDALFLPTLLEVFSASYPEAMKMQKPILTSNYSFALDICQDAALYFDPLDPKDIAKKIKELVDNQTLQDTLVENGKMRLQQFETARSRAEKYLEIFSSLSKN